MTTTNAYVNNVYMNRLEIKQMLERKGITQRSIADLFGTYPSTVNYVISGMYKKSELSRKIREYVAVHIGLKVEEIWPNSN